MITKEESCEVLLDLIDSNILSNEIEDKLHDIITCIRYLDKGLDLFGGLDSEVCEFFIAKRNPYHSSAPYNSDEEKKKYDEWCNRVNDLAKKYQIKGIDNIGEKVYGKE